jgi:hypothetical protein
MRLQQGQIWKHGDTFIRIVHLERLEVRYKVLKDLESGEGTHQHTSKKDLCRLLKSATLLTSNLAARSSPTRSPEGPESLAPVPIRPPFPPQSE